MITSNMVRLFYWIFLLMSHVESFRVLTSGETAPNGSYPQPYEKGFVGRYGDATNLQRERINEGAFETAEQELLFEGVSPRQACPGMVGPFTNGNYYCTAREFGYCDRRSGTCFCNTGYKGIDCSECHDSHFKIGYACFPKKLCDDDCSGAGTCDFARGVCDCLPHRTGPRCETLLCTKYSPLCTSCDTTQCLNCAGGYYLTGLSGEAACSSCYDFDPRCAGCTKDLGCTTCADSLLTSVHRSGYRASDPRLPKEEDTREYGITLPFGTKSPESFADAENFIVVTTPDKPLNAHAQTCSQGLRQDDSWNCTRLEESHIVCGHVGVFTFLYPNFRVKETDGFIRMFVQRSGGGHGAVEINYFIKHFTTNDSDVIATAPYTTVQRLFFGEGVVQRSFLISILDDNIVEEDEVFQVVLETPEGGGAVGAQFRANVTIVDDDRALLSPVLTKTVENTTVVSVAEPFSVHVRGVAADGSALTMGGDRFYAVIGNNPDAWRNIRNPLDSYSTLRQPTNLTDLGNGTYQISTDAGIKPKGVFDLHVYHAFPRCLQGEYYFDAFFDRLAVRRLDHLVNFTWGRGRLIPRGSDYISIRWSGALLANQSTLYRFQVSANDHARLWVNNNLMINNWQDAATVTNESRPLWLQGGALHEIVLEFLEVTGEAHAALKWAYDDAPMHVIPQDNLYALFEVDRSPIKVTVKGGATSPNATQVHGDGLGNATAQHPSHFSFCPRDEFGNLLDDGDEIYAATQLYSATLTLVDDMGYGGYGPEIIVPVITYNTTTHCFDAVYSPERAGTYELRLYYQADRNATLEEVQGSPWIIVVGPSATSGPDSDILGLADPLYLTAGTCSNYTVTVRDRAHNLRKAGGDDIAAYMFRVDQYARFDGKPVPLAYEAVPTTVPSSTPSAAPTDLSAANDNFRLSPESDAGVDVVRYGLVFDQQDGTYIVQLCPVISGTYEVHTQLNSTGVSRQPYRVLDRWHSSMEPMSAGQASGVYVGSSPSMLVVKHSVASAYTSTAAGPGLQAAVVGVPVGFMVTVRDAYDNVLRTSFPSAAVTAKLDRTPLAKTTVWNYQNGSYHVEYTAELAGPNLVSVYVDGFQIRASPFTVPVADGKTNQSFSYAAGPGLYGGTAGQVSYFEVFALDLDGNRKTGFGDAYTFTVEGANTVGTTALQPCPLPPQADHPICDPLDALEGHYFGFYTPAAVGADRVRIYLETDASVVADYINARSLLNTGAAELAGSIEGFFSTVLPSGPEATFTDISGALYDNTAGVTAFVNVQLRDAYHNALAVGGHSIELALLGVACRWGTVAPFTPLQGRPSAFYYEGHHGSCPRVYGAATDHSDGSYTLSYNAPIAGQYVMRVALAAAGLNATYFNSTGFGRLVDGNHNDPAYVATRLGVPQNLGTTVSWTGDVGGAVSDRGDLGGTSHLDRFTSRAEANVSFDLRGRAVERHMGNLDTARYNFRNSHWSARWTGLITPPVAELFRFTARADEDSDLRVFVGGRGNEFNGSEPGVLVFSTRRSQGNGASASVASGMYNFSDGAPREIVVEYAHFDGDAHLSLLWESPSTPLGAIPSSAFRHWSNMSHFNTTIHPAALCSGCSTAVGAALTSAQVAVKKSFLVYARDRFGNLMQTGGDVPRMVAVGRDGVAFRGEVTDYGNSTYLIEYLPTQSGTFRMFVAMGCCAPHADVGYATEIRQLSPLLIQDSPFELHVAPAPVDQTRTVASGKGLLGGLAGEVLSLSVHYRDAHNNPTTITTTVTTGAESLVVLRTAFTDRSTGDVVHPSALDTAYSPADATVAYNLTRAGAYVLAVSLSVDGGASFTDIIGSPFAVVISPVKPAAALSVCRGLGTRQAVANRSATFEVQLYDRYRNSLAVGGDRLYVRLLGDASFHQRSLPVVPQCADSRNGRYTCTYTPQVAGSHKLVVRLLNNSASNPGGAGLTGRYFASADGALNGAARDAHSLMRVDPAVRFLWADGLVVPLHGDGSTGAPLESHIPLRSAAGQSVRWSGYLVAPRSDVFRVVAAAQNCNVTVFVDSQLVFDSEAAVADSVELIANAVYAVEVTATVSPSVGAQAVGVDLRWSTPSVREHSVPTFFLYDSAQDVALSPFPVTVSGAL